MGDKGGKKNKNKVNKQKQEKLEKKKEQQKTKLPAKKTVWLDENLRNFAVKKQAEREADQAGWSSGYCKNWDRWIHRIFQRRKGCG